MFHWYHNTWDYFGRKVLIICFMQNLSGLLLLKDNGELHLCFLPRANGGSLCYVTKGGRKKTNPKPLKKICFEDQKYLHICFFFKTYLRRRESIFVLRGKATVLLQHYSSSTGLYNSVRRRPYRQRLQIINGNLPFSGITVGKGSGCLFISGWIK